MYISKKNREIIKQKFDGICAYSGTPLEDDWQIDHLVPKLAFRLSGESGVDDLDNLMPVQRIVNHYKRCLTLEEFRDWYLGGLHERLAKLPKKPRVERSIKRKEYLLEVASLFGITESKPFSGVFYFEAVSSNSA